MQAHYDLLSLVVVLLEHRVSAESCLVSGLLALLTALCLFALQVSQLIPELRNTFLESGELPLQFQGLVFDKVLFLADVR